jgi:hypothetical protein
VKWAYGSETPMRPTGFVDPNVISHSYEPMSFMVEMVALEPGDVLLTAEQVERARVMFELLDESATNGVSETELQSAIDDTRSALVAPRSSEQSLGRVESTRG